MQITHTWLRLTVVEDSVATVEEYWPGMNACTGTCSRWRLEVSVYNTQKGKTE